MQMMHFYEPCYSQSQLWRHVECSSNFESVDEILWCDHSNKTSLAVLLHGTIYFSIFYKNENWNFSLILIFGTLESCRVNKPVLCNTKFKYYANYFI